MELVIKHFNELTLEELHDIYKTRISVFVVEQNCPYHEITDEDKVSYHVYYKEEGKIIAYLRVLPKHQTFETASIGRVISLKRRCGIGSKLLNEGIKVAIEKFNADSITIEAQTYAKPFYEKAGFKQISEEFLEDGIPHIIMKRD